MSLKKYFSLAKFKLFPICRSITGNGFLKSLKIIQNEIPSLKIYKVRSGTKVFDWKIPNEWNIRGAFIKDKNNKKIVDFKKNNLHVVNYSCPVHKIINKKKLLTKIHTIKNKKDSIPYVTSYYKRDWGFCISESQKNKIIQNYKSNDLFKIKIQSSLDKNGFLKYGEVILKGESKQEIFISTYLCHPSMANNELSGPIVTMALIDFFKRKKLSKTLRFVFIPETIGSITYLQKNLKKLKKNIIAGYNLTCIGDNRMHSCMLSKYKNKLADKSLIEAYKSLNVKFKIHSFLKNGSDERQYNSPGIDLPVASIFRSKFGTYPEYHTSKDDFKLVTLEGLRGGFNVAKKVIQINLGKTIPKTKILCEPQMSKRGLYPSLSTLKTMGSSKDIMNFLQYSDGNNDLIEISKLIKCTFNKTKKIFFLLKKNDLISN